MMNDNIIVFNSGVIAFYDTDQRRNMVSCPNTYCRFAYKTVGSVRYYAAASANVKITDIVAVPYGINVNETQIAVIGENQYKIVQIQAIEDGKPKYKLISLQRRGLFE